MTGKVKTILRFQKEFAATGILVCLIILVLCYIYGYSFAFSVNSDNAYFVRAADEMGHGNPLLQGWYGGFFTALTGDILLISLLRLFLSKKIVFYLVGPLCYALIVMLSWLLCVQKESNSTVILALSLIPLVFVPKVLQHSMMTIGMHNVAMVYILFQYFLLQKLLLQNNSFILHFIFFLVLWAGCLADSYVLYYFALPAAAALLLWFILHRISAKSLFLLESLTIGAGVFSKISSVLLNRFGYLQTAGQFVELTTWKDIPVYLANTIRTWLLIFNVDPSEAILRPLEFLWAASGIFCAVLVFSAVVWVLLQFWKMDFLSLALSAGFCCAAGSFTFTTITQAEPAVRYLAPAFFLGMVLLIRLVNQRKQSFYIVFAVLLPLIVFGFGNIPTQWYSNPTNNDAYTEIAGVLQDHDVRHAYGTYWESHSLYYYSDARVEVAPVEAKNGQISPVLWSAKDEWYEESYGANCLIVSRGIPYGFTKDIIFDTFGEPLYSTSLHEIDVYIYDKNISSFLAVKDKE